MKKNYTDQELEDLLNFATLAKTDDIAVQVVKAKIAVAAALMGRGAILAVAHNWACSEHTVNRYADYANKLPLGEIKANDPRLFNACIDAGGAGGKTAADWYWWAIKHKDGTRSARQVRDAADRRRGRKKSRVPWLDGHGEVINVIPSGDGAVVVLDIERRPTGQQPKTVEVKAFAVLEEQL